MTNTSEVTIVGSGIIGLLTAKKLIEAGCSVTIFDKSFTGQESSWAGGGILLPLYPWRQPLAISRLVLESIKQYPGLSNELYNATQIDPEWYNCGLLICKNPDSERAIDWCRQNDIAFENANSHFFSNLNTQTISPLWLPSIAQARNPRLLKSLKAYLIKQGVSFIENCEVFDCSIENGKINKILTNLGMFDVNQIMISAGAWTGKLLNNLLPDCIKPDVFPVKGQMLLFDANSDTLPFMVLDNDHYLIPRRDGKIIAGSSVEYSEFDKSTTSETKEKLYSFATELLPELNKMPLINHWAGLRPGTKQGVPYIDRHSEINNLYINAGHFRNGLVMAPASAHLMADLILDRPPCIDPEPYQLMGSNKMSKV